MKLNYTNIRLAQSQVWLCVNNRARTKTPGLLTLSPSCILYSFLNQVGPRGGMETKGTGQVVEGCRLTGSKRSFAVCQIISRSWTY